MDNNQYNITIGILVFNAGIYLRNYIFSVLKKNFEGIAVFLVIDDQSLDNPMNIVKEQKYIHPLGGSIIIPEQPINMECWTLEKCLHRLQSYQ